MFPNQKTNMLETVVIYCIWDGWTFFFLLLISFINEMHLKLVYRVGTCVTIFQIEWLFIEFKKHMVPFEIWFACLSQYLITKPPRMPERSMAMKRRNAITKGNKKPHKLYWLIKAIFCCAKTEEYIEWNEFGINFCLSHTNALIFAYRCLFNFSTSSIQPHKTCNRWIRI